MTVVCVIPHRIGSRLVCAPLIEGVANAMTVCLSSGTSNGVPIDRTIIRT